MMDRMQFFYGFKLNDYLILNDQIEFISAIDQNVVVSDW